MSLRAAINGKCRECIYDPTPGLGNWRQQITACQIASCSLHPYRPLSKPDARTRSACNRPSESDLLEESEATA